MQRSLALMMSGLPPGLLALAGTLTLVAVLALAGCTRPSTVCRGPTGKINVCVNGRRIDFAEGREPFRTEAGAIFAPVDVLARKLQVDVRTVISADGHSALVTVNRRPFNPAMAHDARGVQVKDGVVYLPLRELGLAAGLKLDLDTESGTAGFAVP